MGKFLSTHWEIFHIFTGKGFPFPLCIDHDSFVRKVLSALEGLSEGPWFYHMLGVIETEANG